MTYSDICESVHMLKKKYDETDPFKLCKAMGIILLLQPMGKHEGAIKGFYMKCKRIRTITVNSDLPEIIQKIIVAHELGHATIHAGRPLLRVNDGISSRMIIEEPDAQYLQKHGDMIYRNGDVVERAQGYLIEIEELDKIVDDVIHGRI